MTFVQLTSTSYRYQFGLLCALFAANLVASPAVAQVTPPATPTPTRVDLPNVTPTTSTIVPTDTLPSQSISNRMTFGENLQLRILQALPARLYLTGTVETSVRVETNVFQFPMKRQLIRQLPQGRDFFLLSQSQRKQVSDILALASREDTVYRILPNLTAGWTFTPRTRLFCNYFFLRDSLAHNIKLNTNINSLAYGLQQDIPIGSRSNVQVEMQFRDLWQTNQLHVFDFLPGITATSVITPRTVAFVNALLQLRGTGYFKSPNREIDPFYTWGLLHQRGGWTFSASSTFVQNFREPFREHATIPINNYSMISDFEIARRPFKQIPGLQLFFRAEPIWNMHAQRTPGLSGFDFRAFFGGRFSAAKPALTSTLEQLRQQINEQENAPTAPKPQQQDPGAGGKPSASVPVYEYIAHDRQPIHGMIPETPESLKTITYAAQQAQNNRQAAFLSQTVSSPQTGSLKDLIQSQAASPSIEDIEFSMSSTMAHPKLVAEESLSPAIGPEPVFDSNHIVQSLTDDVSPVQRLAVSRTVSVRQSHPQIYVVPPMPAVDIKNKNQPFAVAGDSNSNLRPAVLQTVR